MRKILLIAKRDYLAVVRTKAFLIGLVAAPLLCAATILPMALMKRDPDLKPKRIAVLDRTGVAADTVLQALRTHNEHELFDKTTGLQVMPRYQFESVAPAGGSDEQRLMLSDEVRRGELFAFVEIGAKSLDPGPAAAPNTAANSIDWYSNEGGLGLTQQMVGDGVNDGLRKVRLGRLGVEQSHLDDVLRAAPVQKMNLVSRDEKTGKIGAPSKTSELEAVVPIVVVILLLMIVVLTSTPMLTAISEDKMQRVFEMLLVSATPFELIAGKVVAAIGRSLTSAVVIFAAALFLLSSMAMMGLAPLHVLPWFVVYMVAEVTMLAALASALGAACGTPQEANSFSWLLILPVMVPFFVTFPMMSQPNGTLAVSMSMFPLFTPIAMLVRQVSPGGIPAWQPWVGFAGIAFATIAVSWLAARIFRVGILMQGKPPKLADLVRWAVRG